MKLAPGMIEAGARVIDLSGAFRLRTPATTSPGIRKPTPSRSCWRQAAYGLPEFYRELIPGARLVSNPGCYPTAANLAIRPLVEAGVIDRAAGIVCDAKSGVSGAGRKPTLKTSFCEVADNFSAYNILRHRHVPEVLLVSVWRKASSASRRTCCRSTAAFSRPFTSARATSAPPRICSPFTRKVTRASRSSASIRPIRCPICAPWRTPTSAISASRWTRNPARAVIVSAIDNLVKGAAGQAIQNMNLLLGYPETEGLL